MQDKKLKKSSDENLLRLYFKNKFPGVSMTLGHLRENELPKQLTFQFKNEEDWNNAQLFIRSTMKSLGIGEEEINQNFKLCVNKKISYPFRISVKQIQLIEHYILKARKEIPREQIFAFCMAANSRVGAKSAARDHFFKSLLYDKNVSRLLFDFLRKENKENSSTTFKDSSMPYNPKTK